MAAQWAWGLGQRHLLLAMAGSRFSEHLKKTEPGQRLREAVSSARMNALGTLAEEAAIGKNIRGGPGVSVRRGPSGVVISVRKPWGSSSPVADHPWRYRPGNTALEFKMTSGTVNGIVPSGMSSTLTIATESVLWVWVEVGLSEEGEVESAALDAGDALPTADIGWFSAGAAPANAYLILLRVASGTTGIDTVEQVENKNRTYGRSVVYMNCTETKYQMNWL